MPNESNLPTLLIIGAGPVGLTMACELARHGVPCRIIDKAPKRSQTSKALAIFPRTLEAFATIGIADAVLAEGRQIFGLDIRDREKQLAHIALDSIASPYPFAISLPQAETERILIEQLDSLGVHVERSVEFVALTQTNTAVQATVRHADGSSEIIETPWLCGCDGAHSGVRHAVGMQFEGAQYEEGFLLADVRVESNLSSDEAHLFFSEEGLFALFPFRGDRGRIIANLPLEAHGENLPEPTLADIERLALARGPRELRLSDPVWISRFRISHRKVANFRKLRVFLAGDAAHIHSPAGGQGMNTGIQDAFNLAWKLALVVQGRAPMQLLGSYNAEREPIARGVLNLTDRLTRVATTKNRVARSMRNLLLPVISGFDFLEGRVAEQMTELAVNYRASSIVENHGGTSRLRAGDRAPDGELRDENDQPHRLFELFREPRHVLLVFLGARGLTNEFSFADFGDLITTHQIARGLTSSSRPRVLRDLTGNVHHNYELAGGGLILVRPDGYIAFRSDRLDPAPLRNFLNRILTA